MAKTISVTTLEGAARAIDRRIGFHFPHSRHADLERALLAAMSDTGFDSLEAYVEMIGSEGCPSGVLDALISRVSIGETYFFRHAEQFEALEARILPDLIAARRSDAWVSGRRPRLSLWSAAGSSGEEAYSLAILLRTILPDADAWDISIASSDINPPALSRARKAEYGPWSFRGVPDETRDTWFSKTEGGSYRPVQAIRSMVSLMKFNLADSNWDLHAAGIQEPDIVLCRNVLLYFSPERIDAVLHRLHEIIAPGGWLVVGPSEAMSVFRSDFEPVSLAGTTLFRKSCGGINNPMNEPAREPTISHESADGYMSVREVTSGSMAEKSCPDYNPASGLSDFREAHACADAGMSRAAREACDRALVADRTNPDFQYLRAMLDLEAGDTGAASERLRRVLFLKPDFTMAHYTLGNLELAGGNRSAAMRHYRNALSALGTRGDSDIVPESDGIPAGRLAVVITNIMKGERAS